MIREASAMTIRQRLGEVLNGVQYRHDTVVVTKGGKPVAALVDIGLFDKIRLMEAEFDRLTGDLARAYEGIDEDQVAAEVAEAVRDARAR